MSKHITIQCDVCGEVASKSVPVTVLTGREPDPSGNGYVDDCKHYDVCFTCVQRIANRLHTLGMFPNINSKPNRED